LATQKIVAVLLAPSLPVWSALSVVQSLQFVSNPVLPPVHIEFVPDGKIPAASSVIIKPVPVKALFHDVATSIPKTVYRGVVAGLKA
jgi:hypothetical protein